MINLDVQKVEACWSELKQLLRTGLIRGDVWDASTGLSIANFNGDAATTAFLNQLVQEINDSLAGSGFPKLHRYLLINLENSRYLLINHGDGIFQGIELENEHMNLGLVFNVAVPRAIKAIQDARN